MEYSIIEIKRDTTKRLSLRKGEILIWFSLSSMFLNPKSSIQISDIWQLNDGDFITITNRYEDFPEWLELFPTEVTGSLAIKLLDKFNKGEYPEQPIDGANIWRVKSGDKIAWIKDSEQQIISFDENAFVIGDNSKNKGNPFQDFGVLTNDATNPSLIKTAQDVQNYISKMGLPRTFATEWRIG